MPYRNVLLLGQIALRFSNLNAPVGHACLLVRQVCSIIKYLVINQM